MTEGITQFSQYLIEFRGTNNGKIGCVVPIATVTVSAAKQVAKSCGWHVGDEVGYNILSENSTCEKTIIK